MRPAAPSVLRSWLAALACTLTSGSIAAMPTSGDPVSNPLGGGAGVTLEPAPASAAPRTRRPVFVCRDDATPTFSDRPCGPLAIPQLITVDSPPVGRAPSTLAPPTTATVPARTLPRPAVAGRDPESAAADRCRALRLRLDALDDRMRAGYSATEAARLWTRWRDLKAELRSRRC